jgi:hypothetical protein
MWHTINMRSHPVFTEHFLHDIGLVALKIAWNQREDGRQQLWADPETPELLPVENAVAGGKAIKGLSARFHQEIRELALAEEPWDELPDVMYYGACLWLRRADPSPSSQNAATAALSYIEARIIPQYGVSWVQLEVSTLAKYRLRASGMPKNFLAERQTILAAVRAIIHLKEERITPDDSHA